MHAPRQSLARREGPRCSPRSRSACSTFDGLKTVYTRVGEQPRGMSEITEDTIGVIQFEFADWQTRPPAHEIMDAIRAKTADIPGILVEVTAPRAGPPTGKPIQVQLSALDPAVLPAAAKKVAAMLAARSRHPRSRRRPAAARHRLEDRGRQGGGGEIRRRRQHRRQRGAARHQRRSRSPNTGRPTATSRSTSSCASRRTGAASTRSTSCACRRQAGHVPIGNFVAARAGASASATSIASTATA